MGKTKRDDNLLNKKSPVIKKVLDQIITKVLPPPGSTPTHRLRSSTANIKVIVRVRPPNAKEHAESCKQVVEVVEEDMLIFDPEETATSFFFHGVQQKGRDLLKKPKKNMKFYFDRIYPQNSTNQDFFQGTTCSLIDCIMEGYNCSVFAYGATGSGKTFTMTGTAAHPGITFLTMTELFKRQDQLAFERNFELGITYLEVYNELVKDLLNLGPPLHLREDSRCGVIVAGIKIFRIQNANQLFALLQQGNMNRTQHPTDANAESSRSHAVFQVYLKMTMRKTKEVRTAKLSMIDLAGSERGSSTGHVDARFAEGANINKSLLALGNCINSLADGHRYVPYRDSKLTRLLKDSLGGNCQTVMIANISPSSSCYDDTYNTLKYATRANSIKACVHKNVSKPELNVDDYAKLVDSLTKENQIVKEQLKTEKLKNDALEKECSKLKLELENSVILGPIEDSLVNEIKAIIRQKSDLLEKKFLIEKKTSCTALKRLLKEEIDKRLNDVCANSAKNIKAGGDSVKSTMARLKTQETVLEDIERAEDEIERRLHELETQNPQCRHMVMNETLKLDLRRTEHKLVLERQYSELLVEEQEERSDLMDKMSGALKACFSLLRSQGLAVPSLTKQYADIVQCLQDKKNAKTDLGAGKGVNQQEKKNRGKKKFEASTGEQIHQASASRSVVKDSKTKIPSEPELYSGSKVPCKRPISKSARVGIKSPKRKISSQTINIKTPRSIIKSPKLVSKLPKYKENAALMKNKENNKNSPEPIKLNIASNLGVKSKIASLINRPKFR